MTVLSKVNIVEQYLGNANISSDKLQKAHALHRSSLITSQMWEIEIVLAAILDRMEALGIGLDTQYLNSLHAQVADNKQLVNLLFTGNDSVFAKKSNDRVCSHYDLAGKVFKLTCSKPAVTLVPKSYRKVFKARSGYTLISCDIKALHVRILAHYLAKLGYNELVHTVASGDIHTQNQIKYNLESRDEAKKQLYALLYSNNTRLKISGLSELKLMLNTVLADRGHLNVLGQLKAFCKDNSQALSYLILNTDGILMKTLIILLELSLKVGGLKSSLEKNYDYEFVMLNNDEIVLEVKTSLSSTFSNYLEKALCETNTMYSLLCPLQAKMICGATL